MKIIDLLNKIANGEEVPKRIKWGEHILEWFVYDYKALNELGKPSFFEITQGVSKYVLNDEVEILEEEKKIPEKLKIEQDTPGKQYYIKNEYGTKCGLTQHSRMIAETLNEVIDYLHYLKSKGDE